MASVNVTVDEDLAALLQGLNQPLDQAARELILLELYRRGRISSGKAAELLDLSRWEFIRYASRLGIPFFEMGEEEWNSEQVQADRL